VQNRSVPEIGCYGVGAEEARAPTPAGGVKLAPTRGQRCRRALREVLHAQRPTVQVGAKNANRRNAPSVCSHPLRWHTKQR